METREGLLITIIDTAHLATVTLDQIDLLVADLLAGAEMNVICSKILYATSDARAAMRAEERAAERLRSTGD